MKKLFIFGICLLSGCASPYSRKADEVLFLRHLVRQNLEAQVMRCEDVKKSLWDTYIELKGRLEDLK